MEALGFRDLLIILNLFSMVGGAFYLVGMFRNEIRHLATAIDKLSSVSEISARNAAKLSERVASLEAKVENLNQ